MQVSLRIFVALLLVVGLAPQVRAESLCFVKNTEPIGRGSLYNCLEQANEADASSDPFDIVISRRLAGETIVVDPEIGLPEVRNRDFGEEVKTVVIKGPRTRGEGNHVLIDATGYNDTVLGFSIDISVKIKNLSIRGGSTGILVFGESSEGLDAGLSEFVVIEDVTIIESHIYGIQLIDVKDVHLSDVSIIDAGDDGLRYEQLFGIGGDGELDISIDDCHFIENGRTSENGDGADIRPTKNAGIIAIKDSEFSNNADDGCDVDNFDVPEAGERLSLVAIEDSHFNNNDDEGLKAVFVDVEISKSEFDGNADDGCELEGGTLISATRSHFNDNHEDGLELEGATAVNIKLCEFNDNVEYGIKLAVQSDEVDSVIGSIIKSSLSGNGFGAIGCEAELDDVLLGNDLTLARTSEPDEVKEPSAKAQEKLAGRR